MAGEGVGGERSEVTDEWTEVWLQGQPSGANYYDFTFCSDRESWAHWEALVAEARRSWTDVRVRRREVRRTAWVSPWREVGP